MEDIELRGGGGSHPGKNIEAKEELGSIHGSNRVAHIEEMTAKKKA